MPTVALATCRAFPDLDDEDRLLIPALAAMGVDAVPAVWTDDGIDWSSFDAVVLRETWDYSGDRDAFLGWLRRVSTQTPVLNPVDVVEWNTDKRYLRDLAQAGMPVVPTVFVEPGDAVDAWLPDGDHTDVVVKPAVSCGSRDTMRYGLHESRDDARIHVRDLLAQQRTVMVQPYLDAVDTIGETAVIFFGGVFSHAIRKGPLLARGQVGDTVEGLFLREQIDPRPPTDAELDTAQRIVRLVPGGLDRLLYARVDLVPGPDGSPLLLELELAEPSLFLSHAPGAPERLAAAIVARLG